MSQLLLNQVRIDQTRRQLSYLQEDITSWLKKRRRQDTRQQYQTQLNVLEGVLVEALNCLRAALDAVTLDTSSSDLYSRCRVFEQRIVWVRRVWEYFREKFDQRDDVVLGPLLAAADEVVWSCYAEVFQRAAGRDHEIKQGPSPLAFVDLRYSPHAIPRAELPPGLKSDIDAPFVREFLRQLPIPLVALPNNCIQDPWWLVSLGHEVGHHVQYDLLPDWQFVELFAEQIRDVLNSVPGATVDEQTAHRWMAWGREIFADLFSILCMGPWAMWIIHELELTDDRAMLKNKVLYPAPITRLSLMQHVLNGLDLDENVIARFVKGLMPDSNASPSFLSLAELNKVSAAAEGTERDGALDLKIAPQVAAAIVNTPVRAAGSLRELCGWNKSEFEPYQTVFTLASQLLQTNPPRPLRNLRGARLFASASIGAWAAVSTTPDEGQRQAQRIRLTENILPALRESRQEGTRAAGKFTTKSENESLGAALGNLLLQADPEQLGTTGP